jgi:HEAT repeat protein
MNPIVARMAALLALLAVAGCGGQPAAHGKRLSEWMEVLRRSNDVNELKTAGAALAELGPRAEPAAWELVRLLSDRDAFGHYRSMGSGQVDEVFAAFSDALRAIGAAAAPHALQAIELGRPISADVVRALGPEALVGFAGGLNHQDHKVRAAVAERLADAGAAASFAAPALVAALRDPHESVRKAAAQSLASISPDPDLAVPGLLAALDDKFAWVRLAAVESLGNLQPARDDIVAALMKASEDSEPLVRRAAASVLARHGPAAAPAAPALVRMLDDEVRDNRIRAMGAIFQIQAVDRVPTDALIASIQSMDAEMLPRVMLALLDRDPDAREAVPKLFAHIGNQPALRQADLIKTLSQLDERILPALIAALRYGLEPTPPATELLPDHWQVRRLVLETIASFGPAARSAEPAIEELLGRETNISVIKSAQHALQQIRRATRR